MTKRRLWRLQRRYLSFLFLICSLTRQVGSRKWIFMKFMYRQFLTRTVTKTYMINRNENLRLMSGRGIIKNSCLNWRTLKRSMLSLRGSYVLRWSFLSYNYDFEMYAIFIQINDLTIGFVWLKTNSSITVWVTSRPKKNVPKLFKSY